MAQKERELKDTRAHLLENGESMAKLNSITTRQQVNNRAVALCGGGRSLLMPVTYR
jgi:hypothetical protein